MERINEKKRNRDVDRRETKSEERKTVRERG